MVTALREHFGKLLEPGLKHIFYEKFKEIPSKIPALFNMQTTDEPYVEDLSIGGMGDFPKFTGTVEYDRMYQGYSTVYEFPEYAKGFQIERKLFDDERYNVINKRPVGLAISAARRREKDAAAIFNNAFDTSYTGGDGKPLCASNHPTTAPDGPAARSNKTNLELSHDNLLTVRNLMLDTRDDRGEKILMNPDTLLVPRALEETAWQIISKGTEVKTADGDPNIHQGKYKLVVWDYLESDKNWFLIDSSMAKLFLNWYDRVPLEFAMTEDFDTLVAKYRAYMRYSAGWSDWVWVYGSQVE